MRYWFFVGGVLLLTAFVGYGTFATARLLKHWQPDRNLLLLPAENVMRLILVGVCIGLGYLSGLGENALGWLFVFPMVQILIFSIRNNTRRLY